MNRKSMTLDTGYGCPMDSNDPSKPWLYPNEIIIHQVNKVVFEDLTINLKMEGSLILTSYRLLLNKGVYCVELPLTFIEIHDTFGGLGVFQTLGIVLKMAKISEHAAYAIDFNLK